MKLSWCLVFLSIGLACGEVADNFQIVEVPKSFGLEIANASDECIKELGLEPDTMKKYFEWKLEDSESTRKYIFCLGNTTGYVDDNGYIIKNKLLSIVGIHKDKVNAVVDECNKPKYIDKYETVYRIVMCFKKDAGIKLKIQ